MKRIDTLDMNLRYAEALKLLGGSLAGKAKNLAPQIRWICGTQQCWYQRETIDGHEWVVVDATTGMKRAAFDHQLLAEQLAQSGKTAEAKALPIHVTAIHADDVAFSLGNETYRYEPSSNSLQKIGPMDPSPGPSRSPNGRWLLSQHDGNLWLAADGAEAQQITFDGTPDDGYAIYHGNFKAGYIPRSRVGINGRPAGIEWAPDSSKLIVWRIDQRHVKPYPFLETAPHDGSFRPKLHMPRMPLTGEPPPTIRWLSLDLSTRQLTPLQLPDDQLHLHQDWTAVRKWMWSPDCTHAWAIVWGDGCKAAYLVDIDLATGNSRIVVSEHDDPRVELNTTSYSDPAVGIIGNLEQVIWFSQRSGWGHLYRYDGNSGELLNAVTSGDWLVRDLIDIHPKTGRVVFTASGREGGNPYLRSVYSVNADGTDLRLLTPERTDADVNPGLSTIDKATEANQQLSPDHEYLVYTHSTVSQPPKTCILRIADAHTVAKIEEADVSAVLEAGHVPPEEFTALAADGKTELYGLLYRPKNLAVNECAPLVVAQYASPLMSACPRDYFKAIFGGLGQLASAGALTAMGCAVMAIDARGTTSRDRAFATAGQNRLNIIGLDDYAAVISQLGERHAWLDTSRVGIQGASYGGFTTIRAMIEFPEVFTVGISGAPLTTVHGIYPDYHWTGWHGEPDYGNGQRLRVNETDKPLNYANMDATQQVDRIKGNLLLVVGDLDENCPLPPIMQFYAAAVEADAPVDLLLLPDRNHHTLARTRYTVRKIMDYFCRHLLQQEPPREFRFNMLPQKPEPDDKPTAW